MKQKADAALAALAAFPAAEPGQKRWLIFLEPLENSVDEANHLVRLSAVMRSSGDGKSHGALSGSLVVQSLPGWGYSYVRYEGETRIRSARSGPKAVSQVDTWACSKYLICRYNSQLPLVAYTPGALLLQHAVFKLSEGAEFAQEG